MATYKPDVLVWLGEEWCDEIASATCSGIVNDSGDIGKTSKHWSRQDNPPGSWAVTHAKDKKGPSNMACAIDMTMSESDMKLVHGRFKKLFNDRATDPRAAYVDCFNGWDGSGSPGRYDLPAGTVSVTDDSHKWHEHVETFYQYVGTDAESQKAMRAILSVVRGETVEQWLAGEEIETMSAKDVHDAVWVDYPAGEYYDDNGNEIKDSSTPKDALFKGAARSAEARDGVKGLREEMAEVKETLAEILAAVKPPA